MSAKSVLKTLLLLVVLMLVSALPVRAAESLILTCTVCTQVVATGKGLPANQTVRLDLADVRTGQPVVQPVSVATDSAGSFVKKVNVDLHKHPSLLSSVWTSQNGTLVVSAHNRFDSPCKPNEPLAFTGSNSTLWLLTGLLLLGGGVTLVRAGRRSEVRG